jgi:hypothetical protein
LPNPLTSYSALTGIFDPVQDAAPQPVSNTAATPAETGTIDWGENSMTVDQALMLDFGLLGSAVDSVEVKIVFIDPATGLELPPVYGYVYDWQLELRDENAEALPENVSRVYISWGPFADPERVIEPELIVIDRSSGSLVARIERVTRD